MATIEKPATYEPPGRPGSLVEVKDRYDNFIGGAWTPTERRVGRDGRAVLRHRRCPSSRRSRAEGFSLEGLDGVHFLTATAKAIP